MYARRKNPKYTTSSKVVLRRSRFSLSQRQLIRGSENGARRCVDPVEVCYSIQKQQSLQQQDPPSFLSCEIRGKPQTPEELLRSSKEQHFAKMAAQLLNTDNKLRVVLGSQWGDEGKGSGYHRCLPAAGKLTRIYD